MSDVGRQIRRLRIEHGVSQRSLARRAGTTQAAVSRIERGLTKPRWETVRELMLALGYEAQLTPRRLGSRADTAHLNAMRARPPEQRLALAISANGLAARLAQGGRDARR